MKKTVCMIGPFPPPINGNSKAFETIYKSNKCNQLFNLRQIDLYKLYSGHNGKLSVSKFFGFFSLIKAIRNIRKEEVVDIYYISIAQSTVGVLRDITIINEILKQKKNSKIILHMHGGGWRKFYDQTTPILRHLIKHYFSKVDNVIVLSKSMTNMFKDVVEQDKILVIPNCVDNDMLLTNEEFNEKMNALKKGQQIKILYLSNFVLQKGYKDLLMASFEYHKTNPEGQFIFAGNFFSDRDKIEFLNSIKENHANEYIDYVGAVYGKDKRELLKKCNVFVLPTFYPNEGQPISIIECMSSGMSILSTNYSGMKDLIQNGVNGFFVEPQNPSSILEMLKKTSDISVCESQSRKNRLLAQKYYTEGKYIDNICEVFK